MQDMKQVALVSFAFEIFPYSNPEKLGREISASNMFSKNLVGTTIILKFGWK